MTNSFKRKLAFYFFSFILAFILVSIVTCVAKAQEPIKSIIGLENAMTDIPDGYYLSKSDTVKCILVASSNLWYEGMPPMSFDNPEPNFRPGYVVTEKHRFKSDGIHIMSDNRPIISKLVFLDRWKKPLKREIVWAYKVVEEQTDLEAAMSAEPMSIKGHFRALGGYNHTIGTTKEIANIVQVPTEPQNYGGFKIPVVKESLTPQYDSSQYVRIAEFQELKQKLHDQKEAYRRELMALVLARFCTFMSVEKAALEAVKYADGLIKELEK